MEQGLYCLSEVWGFPEEGFLANCQPEVRFGGEWIGAWHSLCLGVGFAGQAFLRLL